MDKLGGAPLLPGLGGMASPYSVPLLQPTLPINSIEEDDDDDEDDDDQQMGLSGNDLQMQVRL